MTSTVFAAHPSLGVHSTERQNWSEEQKGSWLQSGFTDIKQTLTFSFVDVALVGRCDLTAPALGVNPEILESVDNIPSEPLINLGLCLVAGCC